MAEKIFNPPAKTAGKDLKELTISKGKKMDNKSEVYEIFKVKEYKCAIHMFDGRTITGRININPMGRLSDMFTQNKSPFVVIYDAVIGDDSRKRTFILNKSGISWVEPGESVKTEDKKT